MAFLGLSPIKGELIKSIFPGETKTLQNPKWLDSNIIGD